MDTSKAEVWQAEMLRDAFTVRGDKVQPRTLHTAVIVIVRHGGTDFELEVAAAGVAVGCAPELVPN